MKIRKKGISLIVLVITIIVIIILAGAVILGLASNNPISQAAKATFLSDVRNFETELDLYESQQFLDKMGAYNPTLLQADEASVTYDGEIITGKTMHDLIPALGKATKYAGQFVVVDGKLIYQGSDTNSQNWSRELGVQVIIAGEPKVTILPPTETIVSPGTDIVYTVKFSSNSPLTTIDLTGKIEVLDNNEVALSSQPVISIGTISGTTSDSIRQVDITVKTDNLAYGTYKLRIKAGSVTNGDNISNSQDTISLIDFDVADTIPPENPTMLANPTTWTNGNVSVTINYSADSATKEYSLDTVTWNTYTTAVIINTNNTTVYARGKDTSGNESGVATLTVSNIDKNIPVVTFVTNGGDASVQASTVVNVTDINGSGVSSLKYIWNTSTDSPLDSAFTSTFTNGQTLTYNSSSGTYYLWILASDNAGNTVKTRTNAFVFNNKPVAVITNDPAFGLDTETYINWSYASSTDPDGDSISNAEWQLNSNPVTSNPNGIISAPGTYTMKLRVQDSKNKWSDWVEKQIVVNAFVEFTAATFTNASATGAQGPTQAQINTAYVGTLLDGKVISNNGIQSWVVPTTALYRIEAYGAKGGGSQGGKGASIVGTFSLVKGQTLKIIVGQMGITGTSGHGGGGGTFLLNNDNTPLLVAGGGGGGTFVYANASGSATTAGNIGSSSYATGSAPTIGGDGDGYNYGCICNGAGITTNISINFVGRATYMSGGFGGGGCGRDNWYSGSTFANQGGGGGYTGGSASVTYSNTATPPWSSTAGGAGSYNSGTDQLNTAGQNITHGKLVVTKLN